MDLVPDPSTKTFIRSIKRFVGRREIPSLAISDNDKTFKGPELKDFLTSRGIKWNHIVDCSPWWGEFYERMVRGICKEMPEESFSYGQVNIYEELLIVLIEIEGVLNSRPLTYQDRQISLTTSHLVYYHRLLSSPQELEESSAINSNEG